MADNSNCIDVEVVAEVRAVERQSIEITYLAEEGVIHMMQFRHGELQSLTFPALKARVVCDAILAMAAKAHG